jgi:hypothetical protein
MTNTDSPLDGILGSVIQEAIEYQAANDGEDTLTHARYLEESRKEAIAAINTYTTNKIIEARLDELQKLNDWTINGMKTVDDICMHLDQKIYVLDGRIKALNHRKDKHD